MSNLLMTALEQVKTVAIAGHTRPDGDCVGSCMALYNYIINEYQDIKVDIYLEPIADVYKVIKNTEAIKNNYDEEINYDLFVSLDSSDLKRLGGAGKYFISAAKTICIDHHISNTGFADENYVNPESSSTCETLFDLLADEKVNQDIAEALYIGIICDTGCFRHANTSEKTLNITGRLISKGVCFSMLIDTVFYQKTFMQNQLLGRCLIESMLMLDGKCIISVVSKKILAFYRADSKDLEGVINQLRVTKGVEVAILLTETDNYSYKISMRSNGIVDVNKVAAYYGGGGHILAAGAEMTGSKHDVINNLVVHIEEQLVNHD